MGMPFYVSDICSAFNGGIIIGTKVIRFDAFVATVQAAIDGHDFTADRVPGQAFLMLPDEAKEQVSAGVGKRASTQHKLPYDCFVVREHRGEVGLFLLREYAAPVEGVAVVVYTAEAFLSDPEVQGKDAEALRESGCNHVVVAVLGFAGPKAPLTPHRFVSNLAGGNKEALLWSADEIRAKAKEVLDYDAEWCVVAD